MTHSKKSFPENETKCQNSKSTQKVKLGGIRERDRELKSNTERKLKWHLEYTNVYKTTNREIDK